MNNHNLVIFDLDELYKILVEIKKDINLSFEKTNKQKLPDINSKTNYLVLTKKEIPGFGELFRQLSFSLIGTSTIQSRATAGVARGTYLFALPGSTGACRDAWDGILCSQLDIRHRPCNFAELIPRLREN